MAKNARAVVVDAFNAQAPASAARLVSKPVRDPGPGEVLVRMRLAGAHVGLRICSFFARTCQDRTPG
jgi:D-arabinose 1-dehydrogenase-like Zn-dependent alcohol dehydrogenase